MAADALPSSLRRISYTLPSLLSFEDDGRHRYLPDPSGPQVVSVPVLTFPLERPADAMSRTLPCVAVGAPRAARVRARPARALRPQHMRPVTSLAVDAQAHVPPTVPDTPRAGRLYSAGRDGRVCAWDLGASYVPRISRSTRAHDNWVASLLLCNRNQTVITGSSDCTVKAWCPYAQGGDTLHELGTHTDFVKDLALAQSADWIVSAALDARVCLWDLREGRKAPMWRGHSPHGIYATGCSHSGGVIATGGIDRVVRGWDPRMREPSFALVGHLDQVRTLAVSADGRHVLSGSSDTTLRLWDVGEQRCLHTFTHHSASVWSVYMDDPAFKTFYSGDRDGYLCRVHFDLANDAAAECVLLGHDQFADGQDAPRPAAIQSIAADGTHVWTTNVETSAIQCWDDAPPAHTHATPLAHCINITPERTGAARAPAGVHGVAPGGSASRTAARCAARSEHAPTRLACLPPTQQADTAAEAAYASCLVAPNATPLRDEPRYEIGGYFGVLRAIVLNDRVHALSIDTGGTLALWNLVQATCVGTLDIDRVREAGQLHALEARPPARGGVASWRPQDTPSDTLALVQHLIEGGAVVAPWCALDTASGELTVLVEQDKVWAAETYVEDVLAVPYHAPHATWSEERTYIGACVLRNLFAPLNHAAAELHTVAHVAQPWLVHWLTTHDVVPEAMLHRPLTQLLPPTLAAAVEEPHTTLYTLLTRMTGYGALVSQPPVHTASQVHPALTPPLVLVLLDRLRAFCAPTPPSAAGERFPTSPVDEAPTSSRFSLRHATSAQRKAAEKRTRSAANLSTPDASTARSPTHTDALCALLGGVLRSAPPNKGTPRIAYVDALHVAISHDCARSGHQKLAYRGRVGHIARDTPLLELLAPQWLLELLLDARRGDEPFPRFHVTVEPWQAPDEGARHLPALAEADAHFSAARMVRAARVATYVQGLLQNVHADVPAPPDVPLDAVVELLCNGQPLSAYTTMAQCHRHCWKASTPMVLQYRRRHACSRG